MPVRKEVVKTLKSNLGWDSDADCATAWELVKTVGVFAFCRLDTQRQYILCEHMLIDHLPVDVDFDALNAAYAMIVEDPRKFSVCVIQHLKSHTFCCAVISLPSTRGYLRGIGLRKALCCEAVSPVVFFVCDDQMEAVLGEVVKRMRSKKRVAAARGLLERYFI
jgi:hypothetical protein